MTAGVARTDEGRVADHPRRTIVVIPTLIAIGRFRHAHGGAVGRTGNGGVGVPAVGVRAALTVACTTIPILHKLTTNTRGIRLTASKRIGADQLGTATFVEVAIIGGPAPIIQFGHAHTDRGNRQLRTVGGVGHHAAKRRSTLRIVATWRGDRAAVPRHQVLQTHLATGADLGTIADPSWPTMIIQIALVATGRRRTALARHANPGLGAIRGVSAADLCCRAVPPVVGMSQAWSSHAQTYAPAQISTPSQSESA